LQTLLCSASTYYMANTGSHQCSTSDKVTKVQQSDWTSTLSLWYHCCVTMMKHMARKPMNFLILKLFFLLKMVMKTPTRTFVTHGDYW